MREFNEDELKIIRRINWYTSRGIVPTFNSIISDTCLSNKKLVIDIEKKQAFVQFDATFYDKKNYQEAIDEIRKFNYGLISTINVIKTLEENAIITTYFETQPKDKGEEIYGNFIGNNDFFYSNPIYDKYVVESLINFNWKSIAGEQHLSNFIKRGFKTKEEKAQQFEIRIAIIALVITTILSIVELFHTSKEVRLLEKTYHLIKYHLK